MSRDETIADADLDIPTTRRVAYDGFRPLALHTVKIPRSGGGDVEQERLLFEIGDVVAILPFDPIRNKLVLMRQFRLGAHLTGGGGDMIEIPAGLVDDGEDVEATARRELQEETHLEAHSLRRAFDFVPSPGFIAERGHLYFAEVDATELPQESGLEAESEVIRPFLADPDEALAALDAGLLHNGYTAIALLWFARHRKELTKGA
ncbi:NUDIX domain-containing protein [Tepidamorphus sp. 3E244]|uniref:NUDIX domain-containing protein n=1 Tax=Tepidamorphus sp. 3E244 TaxID=3385498 RepID=UPI0038FC0295